MTTDTNRMQSIKYSFTTELRELLDAITNDYDYELMGFLTGEVSKDGFMCDGLLIPEQTGLGGHCSITAQQAVNLRKEYGKQCDRIIGHFHSHVRMGVFWSQVDVAQQEEMGTERKNCLFVVGSLGKYLGRVTYMDPFFISTDNVQLVEPEITKTEHPRFEEIRKKVKNEHLNQIQYQSPTVTPTTKEALMNARKDDNYFVESMFYQVSTNELYVYFYQSKWIKKMIHRVMASSATKLEQQALTVNKDIGFMKLKTTSERADELIGLLEDEYKRIAQTAQEFKQDKPITTQWREPTDKTRDAWDNWYT
jgi:proteasome lid subunit RPN8/RPN11